MNTINKSFDPEPAKIVTIQVQNGTGAILDLTLADVKVTFGPAGVPGEQGFDVDRGRTPRSDSPDRCHRAGP